MTVDNLSGKTDVTKPPRVDQTKVPVMGRDVPVTNCEKMSVKDLTKAVLDAGANTAGGCNPQSR